MIALISKKSRKIQGLNNIFKFSLVTLTISKKNIHNSRIEQYFQVFTGDFNDFKELLTIQGLNSMFKCSLVTFMILTK